MMILYVLVSGDRRPVLPGGGQDGHGEPGETRAGHVWVRCHQGCHHRIARGPVCRITTMTVYTKHGKPKH